VKLDLLSLRRYRMAVCDPWESRPLAWHRRHAGLGQCGWTLPAVSRPCCVPGVGGRRWLIRVVRAVPAPVPTQPASAR